jgi:hypothetical protein
MATPAKTGKIRHKDRHKEERCLTAEITETTERERERKEDRE